MFNEVFEEKDNLLSRIIYFFDHLVSVLLELFGNIIFENDDYG